MSESLGRLANPLGAGVPTPGSTGGAGPGGPPGGPPPVGPPVGPGNQLGGGGMPPPGMSPAGPPVASGGAMPTSLAGVQQHLKAAHGRNRAAFEQTGKALGTLDHVRKGLERLAEKGDMVTSEDIIGEASKLVAHGVDPMALAGVLADMPQQGGGEALGGWVVSHAIAAATAEQQLQQAHAVAQHMMGVSAMHNIMAHTVGMRVNGPPPDMPADGGNQLSGAPPDGMPGGGPPEMAGAMGGSLGMGGGKQA